MEKKKIGIVYNVGHEAQIDEIKKILEQENCPVREIKIEDSEEEPTIDEEKIPEEIEETIDWLDILMVILDKESEDDELIEEEIEEAHKRGKTIVGIFPKGGGSDSIGFPPNFKKRRSYTINAESIDKLPNILKGVPVPHENPNGTKKEPTYKVHTVKC